MERKQRIRYLSRKHEKDDQARQMNFFSISKFLSL